MQNARKKENLSRNSFSTRILKEVLDSGRDYKCEVKNCQATNIEIHHVVPVSVFVDHSPANIALLCKDHHALVERFYWYRRSVLYSDLCAEIKKIGIAFKNRAIPQEQVKWFEVKSKKQWQELNTKPQFQNSLWWTSVFEKAKKWASTVKVLRVVDPKDAILEDPWFTRIKRPDLKIFSVINKNKV